jgi:hypothetical protein
VPALFEVKPDHSDYCFSGAELNAWISAVRTNRRLLAAVEADTFVSQSVVAVGSASCSPW